MTGFSTLVSDIREDLNRGTNYDDRIKRAIVNATKFYRARRLSFNEIQGTFQTNITETSLSSDWIAVDSFKRIDAAGQKFDVEERNWLDLERMDVAAATGEPIYYAREARLLRLYPAPDVTYSFSIAGFQALPAVTLDASDSFSNAWFDEGYELITMHAMAEILTIYRKSPEDAQQAQACRTREQEVYNELKREAVLNNATGQVTPFL
jgi:hypothetical protein